MTTPATAPPPSSARDLDPQGFIHALEPLRQRQQWRLDKAMAALARAQEGIAQTEARLLQLRTLHDEEAAALDKAWLLRLDPAAHRRNLAYLASLGNRCHSLDRAREEQREHLGSLRAQCLREQVRLDGLDRQRVEALSQYGDEIRRRDLNEQDRDWLARPAATRVAIAAARRIP